MGNIYLPRKMKEKENRMQKPNEGCRIKKESI
jgi:hypothetical protein